MNKNKALVAVSTGLLKRLSREEAEAVLAHEVSHVANGDMVTLALIQGVVNTFVLFLSRVIGHTVDRVIFRTESGHGPAFWVTVIVADLLWEFRHQWSLCGFREIASFERMPVEQVFRAQIR